MALQTINNGASIGDPNAESVWQSFEKTKQNFTTIDPLLDFQGYKKQALNLTGIDTSKDELSYIAEAIQRGDKTNGVYSGKAWQAPQGVEIIFYTATLAGGGTEGESDISPDEDLEINIRFYRVHKGGQIFGGNLGVEITSQDVSPAGNTIVSQNNSSNFIELGDIGSRPIYSAFNDGMPSPDDGDPWVIVGITLVNATQNGVNKTWNFIGGNGSWGGSNTSDPEYLASQDSDFDLLSNQPNVYPGEFITKSSKLYRSEKLEEIEPKELVLSPESTTFSIKNVGGSGLVGGFKGLSGSSGGIAYDGMDIYIRNGAVPSFTLEHNNGDSDVPFFFNTEQDVVIKSGEIIHLKYNLNENRVENLRTQEIENKPIPFGDLRILKIEGNNNDSAIEVGDRVVTSNLDDDIYLAFGVYEGGDVMDISSYEASSVDFYDPNNP